MSGFFQFVFGWLCLMPWLAVAAVLNWLYGREK
jgi:hypothetical protein